jgi:hypothetical protein
VIVLRLCQTAQEEAGGGWCAGGGGGGSRRQLAGRVVKGITKACLRPFDL